MDFLHIKKLYQYLAHDLLDSAMHLFFSDPEPSTIDILYGWSGISDQFR